MDTINRKQGIQILVIFLIITGIFLVFFSLSFYTFIRDVSAATLKEELQELSKQIEDRKSRVGELEKEIETYKKSITQKQKEALSLKNQLVILTNRSAKAELDIKRTGLEIEEKQLEIEVLDAEIRAKEDRITLERSLIMDIVREVYRYDQKNYIEILLANDDLSSFFNQLQYLEEIQGDLGESVAEIKQLKAVLEQKRQVTAEVKEQREKLKEQLTAFKEQLQGETILKEQLKTETENSETKFRTLLAQLRREYQNIEQEIISIERKIRAKLQDSDKLGPSGELVLSWPTPGRTITAYFHDPEYPYRYVFEHNAVDIRAPQGTPVTAAAAGYVARAKRCSSASCYSYVMLIHTDGVSTVYGHCSNVVVNEDQFVTRGDVVCYSGGTPGTAGAGPFVTGPHLHFEVRVNGIPVDPLTYL